MMPKIDRTRFGVELVAVSLVMAIAPLLSRVFPRPNSIQTDLSLEELQRNFHLEVVFGLGRSILAVALIGVLVFTSGRPLTLLNIPKPGLERQRTLFVAAILMFGGLALGRYAADSIGLSYGTGPLYFRAGITLLLCTLYAQAYLPDRLSIFIRSPFGVLVLASLVGAACYLPFPSQVSRFGIFSIEFGVLLILNLANRFVGNFWPTALFLLSLFLSMQIFANG